ncbi:MAG: CusA/CzcA family heavy metal efflux RND transporter [Myxococcaceae bacterium]|nr:CusA/CzcA family heavy metal efflux RND transporter [Myxococcaceae bacterium]
MLEKLVLASVRHKGAVVAVLGALLCAGLYAASRLPIDALPDVSNVQVTIVTEAPGLSPTDAERMVTTPMELALNGMPGLIEVRSVSRASLSVITAVFKDGTNIWFARQLVAERLREVTPDLPPFIPPPQLAPVSTGLGEIFFFALESENGTHSSMQLRTLLDWELVPRLRAVPGVIEVNTLGGELKQYHIVTSPTRLSSFNLTINELEEAVGRATSSVGGGYLEYRGENLLLRGEGLLLDEDDVESIVVRGGSQRVTVKQVADVKVAPALRYGVATKDGKGEVVAGTVMMVLGANSRDVITAVKARVAELSSTMPPGVKLTTMYDRSEFVNRVLVTVLKNLAEGALVVLLVLAVFLGSLRGAFAVVLGIPASMSVALFVMHGLGVTGDLMSLGAIDFGFLVDGPIVVLEGVLAAVAGLSMRTAEERDAKLGQAASSVARPVAFSVAIIMLVYLPLLTLEGVEGKMFRPMTIVMAAALFGALFYSIALFPGVMAFLLPQRIEHGPHWLERLTEKYRAFLPSALKHRVAWAALSVGLLGVLGFMQSTRGAEFVPRIQEGDIVLGIRRPPSVALTEARRLDLQVEEAVMGFPDVRAVLGMTGRAEMAFDPRGNDATDILIRMKPENEWTSAKTFEGMAKLLKARVEDRVPGTFVSVSQPIEDRTNELISGSRADVAIRLAGKDLAVLNEKAAAIGDVVRKLQGTGDVRIERLTGMPTLTFTPDRERLARYGVELEKAFETIEAARVGRKVGTIYDGPRRFDVRVVVPPSGISPGAVGDLQVETFDDKLVNLDELGSVREVEGPTTVRRENFERTVRVEVNLRGRDLVSWVTEAKAKVGADVPLPTGYSVSWGGQFENFARAQARLALVVPLALAIILIMLILAFGSPRQALAVFTLVPLALIGGLAGLLTRGMSFSIPAAVGFIALAGVAVLNGVVMASEVRRQLEAGKGLDEAIIGGASHTLRAVLTTAAVAALGFAPMALNTGAGSEVQRPLATVVIFGIVGATVLMLVVFPGILRLLLKPSRSTPLPDVAPAGADEATSPAAG